ncbi:MAG: ABC transporter substrate-binding protein [Thermoflexales bacterium]
MQSKTKIISRRKFLKVGAGLLGAAGLSACAAPAQLPAPPASTASGAPVQVPSVSKAKLRLMTWSGGEELELHKKAFAAFTDKNDVDLEVTSVPFAEYYTKLQTEAAGGAAADLINIGEAYTARWAAAKVLLNLSPFIEADPTFDKADFWPNVLENFTWQDGLYVLPKDYVTWGLFYNKTLFDEAGLSYPDETWDWSPEGMGKYLEAARQLTKREGSRITQYGTMAPSGWGYWVPRIKDVGGRYLNESRTKCLLDEPQNVQVFQWLADLVNKEMVAPTAEAQESGFGFNAGKVAMMPGGSFVVPSLLEAPFEWAVAPHPKGPKGRNSIMYSSGYGIYTETKERDAAWKLAVHMTREGSEILAVTGFSVPSRQSIANKPGLYLNEKTIPHNVKVFMDASAYMGLHEITPTWTQEEQIIKAEVSLVMNGEKTAQAAMEAVVPQINALLAKSS